MQMLTKDNCDGFDGFTMRKASDPTFDSDPYLPRKITFSEAINEKNSLGTYYETCLVWFYEHLA